MNTKENSVKARTTAIQNECNTFVQKFADKLKEAVETVSFPLLEYLKSLHALTAVQTWRRDDLPGEEDGDS